MSELHPTAGPNRVNLANTSRDELDDAERKGILVLDERRCRSSYFDGRFLAARDLTREQNYALTRQADLAQSSGGGVIRGLDVGVAAGARSVSINAGQGVTSSGELVTLARSVTVQLDDVAELEDLDATAGLSLAAVPNLRGRRSGLYVLALRPVEFATRAITRYPTTVNGTRSTEPSDIAEAVGIALISYPLESLQNNPWRERSRVAKIAFAEKGLGGIPASVLPLAMLRLEAGTVRWIDRYLVRRDIGSEHECMVGLGVASRALREAHLLQYEQQLQEVLVERRHGSGLRFAASAYFEVLPSAGRMPAAAIEPKDFTQFYFPPTMTVRLSIVPTDEIPSLVEQSLHYSPIQVVGSAEDLDFTTIQVLIPASRQILQSLRPRSIRTPVASPVIPSLRRSADTLNRLTYRGSGASVITPQSDPIAAQWRQLLTGQANGLLWFVRGRDMSLSMQVTPPAAST